jgi:hypothetical protein
MTIIRDEKLPNTRANILREAVRISALRHVFREVAPHFRSVKFQTFRTRLDFRRQEFRAFPIEFATVEPRAGALHPEIAGSGTPRAA